MPADRGDREDIGRVPAGVTVTADGSAARRLLAGETVGGRFTVDAFVRDGGMGSVYRGVDRDTGLPVAVKLVSTHTGNALRFATECRVLAELSHPAIVRYVGHGAHRAGLFLAMEWLDGETLEDRLAHAPLEMVDALELARGVASGLAAAHARGVVHRDVKPSNIILVGGDPARPTLIDFGIARAPLRPSRRTRTGAIVGTVGYMAPEQASGQSDLDARVDVFALGCVLFECLTGEPAFVGVNLVATLAKLLLHDAPALGALRPELPDEVAALVARMLAKDRAHRPGDARAVLTEIGALIATATGGAAGANGPTGPSGAVGGDLGNPRDRTGAAGIGADRAVAVSKAERRLVSVILARGVGEPVALRGVTGSFGGEPVVLADGTALITFGARLRLTDVTSTTSAIGAIHATRATSATDLAIQSASCALALRAAWPDAALCLATGQAETVDIQPVGPVIDRAAALLDALDTLDAPDLRGSPGPGSSSGSSGPAAGIALDDVTAHLLDARFEVRMDQGTALLVGKHDAWSRRTLLGRQTPFVGRDKELAWLEATVVESFDERSARAVLVTAPAGAGKSRLAHELIERVRRTTDATIILARADPMAAGSSLGIARQLVSQAALLRDGDDLARRHTLLAAHLAGLGCGDVEWLAELVGVPTPVPSPLLREARSDPSLMLEQMQRAFLGWLAAEAAARPVLIVVEDLHWGDAASAAWLTRAVHELTDRPCIVLALGRPEVLGQLTAPGTQAISLGGLTRRAAEHLVRAVLGDVAPDLTARLVERSEGNAYYLEELIRHAAERGADGLPGTVLAMMQTRLELLDPDARRVLRAASVFGETFWDAGAAALVRGTPAAGGVAAWLDILAAGELVHKRSTTRFAGHAEYAFRHGLLRDTAYAMLTDDDRAAAHRLAGSWLETAGENDPRVIADHFALGQSPARAVPHLVRAAEAAFGAAQLDAFLALCDRGIALGADGESRGMLRQLQARHHFLRNELPEAMTHAREAIDLLPAGTTAWFHAAGIATITTFSHHNDPTVASDVAHRVEQLDRVDSDWPFAWALNYSVWVLVHTGRYPEAIRLAALVERLVGDAADRDPMLVILLHTLRAQIAFVEGRAGDALRATRAIVARLGDQGEGLNFNLAITVFVTSIVQLHLGDFDELAALVRRAWRKEADLPALRQFRGLGLAIAELTRGNSAPLVAIGDRVVAMPNRFMDAAVRAYIAEAHLAEGRAERAEAFVAPVLDAGSLGIFPKEARAIAARAALVRGRPVDALAITAGGDALRDTARCPLRSGASLRLTRIEALLALGDTAAADEELRAARDRILGFAASFGDDLDARSRFLALPDHRSTLALAAQRLGP